jgi:DNA-directed RNA polymerase subunit beta
MAGRHGNKGVVSKIVDIEDMPYTSDGQPIDVVLNCLGVPGRMNLGQLLETILGMACDKVGETLRKEIRNFSENELRKYLENMLGKSELEDLVKTYGKEIIPSLANNIAKNGMRVATPVFDGANFEKDIVPLLEKTGLDSSGTYDLYDGVTGKKLTQKVTVGVMYMMKLNHMADDKLHARSVGPYSMITQQPLGGKAQFGGQRLGEM